MILCYPGLLWYNNPSLNGNGTLFSLTHGESIFSPLGLGKHVQQWIYIESIWSNLNRTISQNCAFSYPSGCDTKLFCLQLKMINMSEPGLFHAWGDTSEQNFRNTKIQCITLLEN